MTDPISVTITAVPVLSYAMAYNQVAVVERIEIGCDRPVRGATVRVRIEGAIGPLAEPVELLADLGGTTVIGEVPARLDPAVMASAAEQPGSVLVDVFDDGAMLGSAAVEVRVLAGRQWVAEPTLLGLELLSAFVQPHDPALQPVLTSARAQLAAATGDDALQGYQVGPERVDGIAGAVYDALAGAALRTVAAPEGWTGRGQLVRSPAEVLADRQGTSLDLSLLLAATFEAAGLQPVLWITADAAVAGYWREPQALAATATTEIAAVANLVDLSLIRMVAPDFSRPFAHAVAEPVHSVLGGDLERVTGVVDVRQGRRDGIRALPVQAVGPDGTSTTLEYQLPTDSIAVQEIRGDPARAARSDAPGRVEQWKNSLLDLSLRNRLINYAGRSAVGLTVPEGQLAAIEDAVNAGTAIALLPSDQVPNVARERGIRFGRDLPPDQLAEQFTARSGLYTDVAAEAYDARLRGLAYKARTVIEETGANNLYLAMGTLSWSLDGRELRSPLVLVPVRLTPRTRRKEYRLELDESGTSTPNFCLLEKLRQVHGLVVPGIAEPLEDGAGIDLDGALHAMRTALARAGLPYRVEPTADLAILAFAKFRLWKDLDEHWSELSRNPLVHHLIQAPTEPFLDPARNPPSPDLDALAQRCPVPADASQLAAIAEAAAGRTFVLEGPPGTGKSQTITNLLTHAVATGRRVLFVAEKRAALDVVTRRLAAVGLGPFCLDLHDKSSRPAVIRARIKAALDYHISGDHQGMAAAAEQLESSRRRLAAYATRLHEPNAAGLSYYSARTASLAIGEDVVPMPLPPTLVVTTGATQQIRTVLATLIDVADPAQPRPDHPWAFADPAAPTGADPGAIRAAAVEFDASVAGPITGPEVAAVLGVARTPGQLYALSRFASGWAQNLVLLDEVGSDAWRIAAQHHQQAARSFAAAPHPILETVTPQAMALDVDELHAQALAAAGSGFFGRRGRQQAVIAQLAGVLRQPVDRKRLTALTAQLVALRQDIRNLADGAGALPGIGLPPDWNPLTVEGAALLDDQIGWYTWAAEAVRIRQGDGRPLPDPPQFTVALRDFLSSGSTASVGDRAVLSRIAEAGLALSRAVDSADPGFDRWSGDLGLLDRWQATAQARGLVDPGVPSLRRWLALLAHLVPLRTAGAEEARQLLLRGQIDAGDAVAAFDAGVAAASTLERAAATGLDGFEPSAQARFIQRFTGATAEVRRQLVTAIPEQLLSSRSFDAGALLGQVGELQRELVKQRRGLQVRGLLSRYGELITAIMPCILVSPDSLSRYLPPQSGQFDLVVFDEASQIRVADAVGAMGRGNAVVVVGDSRQMPPTSFAEPSSDAGDGQSLDDALGIPDEESILTECVQARVPQRWLSWHYRSQDEALIAFSNRLYYDNRLSSFPAPVAGPADPAPGGHGVSLVRVDGEFQRSGVGKLLRTNPIEAVAVVSEIRRRFELSPEAVPSIGVVTFNAQQRTYIESLLRDLADERITDAMDRTDGEGLFVKNLENVQGDERDVIFFSTAFSVNSRGALPLNFGPLNRSGGERRLNVAVTRARRQVLVFCSFDPAQLRAEETSSVGVKHLRAYLDLAAQGTRTVLGSSHRTASVDRHRDQIAAGLAGRGVGVRTDVGLSEFTIDLTVAPDALPDSDPRMAVLLDGPGWAARRTVGDRDGLPVEVLSGLMRWPAVERVWMPEWLAGPEAVLDRLVARLSEPTAPAAVEMPAEPTRPADPPAGPRADLSAEPLVTPGPATSPAATPVVTRLPDETPFVAWHPAPAGDRPVLDRLPERDSTHRVWEQLVAGIEAEAPIHYDRLTRITAAAYGLTRVSPERRAAILACLPPGLPADPAGEEFAWPYGLDPASWNGFRRSVTDERPFDQVSVTEIGNAMVALCRAAAGMSAAQLQTGTLRVFGFSRRTPDRDARIALAVEHAVAAGRLQRAPDGVIHAT